MNSCKIIDKETAKALLPPRQPESNKGTYGTALIFAGCKEYSGAAYLCAEAPLRVGAGLVELAAPKTVQDKVACLLPDIIHKDMNCDFYLENLPKINFSKYKAILCGCGLGYNNHTKKFIKQFCNTAQKLTLPIIYDADALTIIVASNITKLGSNAIITPHPGEMARLLGTDVAEIQSDREKYALLAAQKFKAVTVLKGHNTIIATPDGNLYKDTLATSILAKAGMGDVLAGIITGFCAQGLTPQQACVLGVYIHSTAGVCAEVEKTSYSLLASELLKLIPNAIKTIIL